MVDDKETGAALSTEYDSVKSAVINALLKGERVEYMALKGGLKVTRVRREEMKEERISNHDCKVDCNLFEKCKASYLKGSVIKCLHFGNKKNFSGLKK